MCSYHERILSSFILPSYLGRQASRNLVGGCVNDSTSAPTVPCPGPLYANLLVPALQAGYTGLVLDSTTAWLQQLDKLADEHKIIPRHTPKRERKPLPEAQRQE